MNRTPLQGFNIVIPAKAGISFCRIRQFRRDCIRISVNFQRTT
ncbi:MAG: hypothetical protein ACR2P4_04755 [Gammaproteobacteria bacterium]